MVPQSLFEFGFSRGVDPFPDNYRTAAEFHAAASGSDNGLSRIGQWTATQSSACGGHSSDMFRRSTAATAYNPGAFSGNFAHPTGKLLGPHIKAGLAVPFHREARIGIDHNGKARGFPQSGQKGCHLFWP